MVAVSITFVLETLIITQYSEYETFTIDTQPHGRLTIGTR